MEPTNTGEPIREVSPDGSGDSTGIGSPSVTDGTGPITTDPTSQQSVDNQSGNTEGQGDIAVSSPSGDTSAPVDGGESGANGGSATSPSPVVQPPPEPTFQELLDKAEEDQEKRTPVKRKPGRPQAIDADVLRQLRQAFLMGCSDEEACAYASIGARTLYDFQTKFPEFSQYKEEWKRNPILKARATIYSNLHKQSTAQWFAERKLKDEFSTRQEMTGKDGEAIPIAVEYIIPQPVKEEIKVDGTEQPTNQPATDTSGAPAAGGEAPVIDIAVPAPTQDPVQTNPEAAPSVAVADGSNPQ